MATRTINECDRCKHEIKGTAHKIHNGEKKLDLCDSCHQDLLRYLDGEALEVPP